MTIILNTLDRVKKFGDIASKFDCDIDVIRNKYIVDGTSILGIFTLDLRQPVDVEIHSDNEEEIRTFNEVMEAFMV